MTKLKVPSGRFCDFNEYNIPNLLLHCTKKHQRKNKMLFSLLALFLVQQKNINFSLLHFNKFHSVTKKTLKSNKKNTFLHRLAYRVTNNKQPQTLVNLKLIKIWGKLVYVSTKKQQTILSDQTKYAQLFFPSKKQQTTKNGKS